MNKRTVIELVIAQITRELQGIMASAKASHAEATHEQNKPENKYDTRALEASYLAHGQSRQIAELEGAIQEFQMLVAEDLPPGSPIDVGALLTLEQENGAKDWYLLGPKAGGTEVIVAGAPVTVITPQSPLGRLLIGRRRGETVVLHQRSHRILQTR